MRITRRQLRRIIREEKLLLREAREFRPSQREGSFVLQDDGTFTLTLELSGREGSMTSAVVEGQLDQDSIEMLEELA